MLYIPFLADTNTNLTVLWVILGVIAAFVVIFGIFSVILWYVLLALEKKVYREFEKVIPMEIERAERTQKGYHLIRDLHLHCKKEFAEQFEKAFEDVKRAETPDEMRKVKNVLDFADLYLGKVLQEYGRGEKAKEMSKSLEENRKNSDKSYESFTKAASSYNSVLAMWPTKLANKLHRKSNRRTRIGLF